VQSATCAYLAALTLGGLLLRSFFGLRWLDPVAALAAVPILIVEGSAVPCLYLLQLKSLPGVLVSIESSISGQISNRSP